METLGPNDVSTCYNIPKQGDGYAILLFQHFNQNYFQLSTYTYSSVHKNRRTGQTFPMARPKCPRRNFTNLNRIYKARRAIVWWTMEVFQLHCYSVLPILITPQTFKYSLPALLQLYIFLDVTPGFNRLGKGKCRKRPNTFKFWDLVHFIS